jgi:hypothetical protein
MLATEIPHVVNGGRRARSVMAGLVPATHAFRRRERPQVEGEVEGVVSEALATIRPLRGLVSEAARRGWPGQARPGRQRLQGETTATAIRARIDRKAALDSRSFRLERDLTGGLDASHPPPALNTIFRSGVPLRFDPEAGRFSDAVLGRSSCLDYARWGSLELDSYSHTTTQHSNKPRPRCRRTRERFRRNRHSRSCSCQIQRRWSVKSGRGS